MEAANNYNRQAEDAQLNSLKEDEPVIGSVAWRLLRVKLRNPDLKDLTSFIGTLTKSEKMTLLNLMEQDFARLHYFFCKHREE